MISIAFIAQRKVVRFLIDDRVVTYYDDNWKEGIQILPSQTPRMKMMLKRMLVSRREGIRHMALLIVDANSGKNKEQYDSCESEEDIEKMITKDCLEKGLVEVR